MAERRMFAKSIVQNDDFYNMPPSAQSLYFALCMTADDDGFTKMVSSTIKICGSKENDLAILIEKGYVIHFQSGVIVITHWKIHNRVRADSYKPTQYMHEKALIQQEKTLKYTLLSANTSLCNDNVTQYSKGKDSVGKDSIDKDNNIYTASNGHEAVKKKKHKYGEYKNVLLSDDEFEKLKNQFTDWEQRINDFSEAIEMKGYKYKSHYLAILKWAKNETNEVNPLEKYKATMQFPDER